MKIIGHSTNPKIRAYLENVYSVFFLEDISGVPLFGKGKEYFLGGYKSFYSVILEEDSSLIRASITSFRQRSFRCDFSTRENLFRSKLVHFLLDVGPCSGKDARFDLYSKKTRNQVRGSYKNDFTMIIGEPLAEFYDLYKVAMHRLGSDPKSKDFLGTLQKYLKEDAVCFSLFDGEKLIGVNYCIRSGELVSLALNVSLPEYWKYNINNRLYDEMICWSFENKIRYIDFGPAVDKDTTHNHFKIGFGAEKRFICDKRFGGYFATLADYCRRKYFSLSLRFRRISRRFSARG